MARLRFRNLSAPVTGRHEAYERHVEGEYSIARVSGAGPAANRLAAYRALTDELMSLIGEAIALDKEIRVYGSAWSASEVGVPRDRLVNSKGIRNLRLDLDPSMVSQNYSGDADLLRFLECGESMSGINSLLSEQGLSLKTSGSNNGQTLAGALSTGTHGSAFDFGAISEFVVGLHLITGPTTHVYLQRSSTPVLKHDFADSIGAAFVESDELFNAALVSFGSFGIIQGALVETRPLFTLHASRFVHPYNQALKTAMTTLDFSGIDLGLSQLPASAPTNKPHHFQVYFNPNLGAPPPEASVLMMFEDQWDNSYQMPVWKGESGPSAAALEIINAIFEHIPKRLRKTSLRLLNKRIAKQLESYYRLGIVRDLVKGVRMKGHLLLSGTAVPMDRSVEALDILFHAYHDFGHLMPLVIATRFVKGSTATLGFTRFARTCVFDIDTTSTEESRQFVNLVRERLEQAGVPYAVHWGKLERELGQFLNTARLQTMYGDATMLSWLGARHQLLENADVERVFSNDFMRNVGLA
jgi:hypothetical protein